MRFIALACLTLAASAYNHTAHAQQSCDPQKSKLVQDALQAEIDKLSCDRLKGTVFNADIGVDKADHNIGNVCYITRPETDIIRMDAELRCKTSDAALIPASFSENISADIRVNKTDCTIDESDVDASGEIGKLIVESLEFFNAFKVPLQKAVSTGCGK